MAQKYILSLNHAMSAERAEQEATRLAEFLGVEREDILISSEAFALHAVEVKDKPAKAAHHKGKES